MRKVIALLIAVMMIVSMIPVVALTVSAADVEGMWTTYRTAADYDEPEEGEEPSYKPAPGYYYDNEGFHMVSADYKNTTPFGTIQSKDKVNLQDGVYMEVRVDEFSYGGPDASAANQWGADNWITFSLSDTQKIAPGSVDYGNNWLSLIRHYDTVQAQPYNTVAADEEAGVKGGFNPQFAASYVIQPELDADGKEIYTFAVTWDGNNYTISICGVVVSTIPQSDHIKTIAPDGELYVGVSFHSAVKEGVCSATILNYGTSEADAQPPEGSDSKDAEENILYVADIMDSATVEEGKPCLIFDANGEYYKGDIATNAMNLVAQGDGSFKVEASNSVGFFQWAVSRDYSYKAEDFPVIAMLIQDDNMIFNGGVIRYSAGVNMSADDRHTYTYTLYEDHNLSYGDDGQYTLVVIDMKELLTTVGDDGVVDDSAFVEGWNGRINAVRFDVGDLSVDPANPDPDFDFYFFHFAAIFRTVEEAQAYGNAYMAELGVDAAPDEEEVTDAPAGDEDNTTAAGEVDGTTAEAVDGTTAEADGTAAEADGTAAEADGTAAEADGTGAEDGTAAEEEEGRGCGSVIGSAAIVFAAMAAAVVLKKKD